MRTSKAVRLACSVMLVSVLAALAALVSSASAGSAAAPVSTQVPVSKVAGVETTRMYINGFRAVGRKVVGRGTAIATFKNAAGHKTKRTRHFNITIRTARVQQQQAGQICQVLFLQLGELDLTLAGLHAVLHAADPTQPVELRLSADDAGGILGRLFCQLANASGVLGTSQKATLAAKQMNKHLRAATIMRVKAIIYAPSSSGNAGMQAYSPQGTFQATDECSVLHLILGPLHLELLGLVADLNKIVLDLTAIPGTLLGNVFCQLVTPPPPPAAPTG
jgi:hypothetical protein